MATNTAATRQLIPTVPAATQRLIDLFDAAETLGYSMLTLFEHSSPGACDALVRWAAIRGLSVHTRSITPPGSPTIYTTNVEAARGGGKLGVDISIHHDGIAS